MQYGKIAGIDKPASRLVQGTTMLRTDDENYNMSLLDGVFEVGATVFDTAHVYGGGEMDRILGRWIRSSGVRDKVIIMAKGAHHNADRRRVTPFDIEADLHDTLARMKLESIDLYVLHRDDPDVPVGPIVEALNRLKNEGHITAFGGSNWSHTRIKEANDYAEKNGLVPFSISSPHFSLAEMVEEPWPGCLSISGPQNREARDYYIETQIALAPWSSLSAGFFSGKITKENYLTIDNPRWKLCSHCYASEDNFKRLERAQDLAKKKGVTTPQIALAYIFNQPMNLFPLVGCFTPAEYAENAEALDIKLTNDELEWLENG